MKEPEESALGGRRCRGSRGGGLGLLRFRAHFEPLQTAPARCPL